MANRSFWRKYGSWCQSYLSHLAAGTTSLLKLGAGKEALEVCGHKPPMLEAEPTVFSMIQNFPPSATSLDRLARESMDTLSRLALAEPDKKVYNLIVLDESGSMESIAKPVIRGFNSIVDTIRSVDHLYPDYPQFVSLVTFSSERITTVLDRTHVSQLVPLDESTYKPYGTTPLNDAVGRALVHLETCLGQCQEGDQPTVLVNILTDGEDNNSRHFYNYNIRELIERLRAKGWTFTYIGTEHKVDFIASLLGIDQYIEFENSEEATDVLFQRERGSRTHYYEKKMAGMSSADAERDYYKNKGA